MDKRTFGEKLADRIAAFGGSWTFISLFFVLLMGWMWLNTELSSQESFDAYPFILLNLVLSCLAAIQAPIIMMSQNRQSERDRKDAQKDLKLSVDIEVRVTELHKKIDQLLEEHNGK